MTGHKYRYCDESNLLKMTTYQKLTGFSDLTSVLNGSI